MVLAERRKGRVRTMNLYKYTRVSMYNMHFAIVLEWVHNTSSLWLGRSLDTKIAA